MKGTDLVLIAALVSLIVVTACCISWWYQLKVECIDYLKLAGDAPTVEKAYEFLSKCMSYVERKGITSGNSGIIFHPPRADLEIWYGQIRGARDTAKVILGKDGSGSLDQLERDNALMKIREVLLDHGESGTTVTKPPWLSWYPHQGAILVWWVLTFVILVVGVLVSFIYR